MTPRRLTVSELINLNVGLMGIQTGWGLQNANMSALYEKLGAPPELLPLLWLAAPATALVVHPLVGLASDRTWTRLGRRRPYLLAGAICSSVALFFMPASPALWIAATLLWVQDAAINGTMEPFRPLVADQVPESQRNIGYSIQSVFIGLGALIGGSLPFLLRQAGVAGANDQGVPLTVVYAFRIGAAVFLGSVLWTVITTRERPPETQAAGRPVANGWLREILRGFATMPPAMRRLAPVQFFSWLGFFCMWMFLAPTIARRVFGAAGPHVDGYNEGIEWAGVCLAMYSVAAVVAAPLLARVAQRLGRPHTHSLALAAGGTGLVSVYAIHDPLLLLVAMAGVGMSWASIHALPYAMLARAVPADRRGMYMGVFTFFIASPAILASLTLKPIVSQVLQGQTISIVVLGGCSLLLASALALRVEESEQVRQAAPARPVPAARRDGEGWQDA
jgi:maltose/moltooligosaccharide transporter